MMVAAGSSPTGRDRRMTDGGMRPRHTTLMEFGGAATLAEYTTAVSLHAHSRKNS
jgi:hypothetical protein